MFCPKCGKEFPDSASFCPNCGCKRPQTPRQESTEEIDPSAVTEPKQGEVHEAPVQKEPQANSSSEQKPRKKKKIFIVVGLVVLVLIILCVLISLFGSSDTEAAISTVRNGYLGEYTDMTTEEILDGYYGQMYSDSTWDSGVTDDGTIIVQLDYTSPDLETTTIQFSMLNKDCFKVTAFVSPTEDIEELTDIYAALNMAYVVNREVQYIEENSADTIVTFDQILWAELSDISGSSVRYGASKDYTGDRSELYQLFGDQKLDLSVTALLDVYYGILSPDKSGTIWGDEPNEVSPTLTDSTIMPDTSLIDENYLNIAEHNYDYNYSWIQEHEGQWVRIDSLRIDWRMTSDPTIYCFLDYDENFGVENYGDFRIFSWNNTICIPLADGMTENCYMYLYDDGYGVMGINAQAVESNLSSDPGYYGSDPV